MRFFALPVLGSFLLSGCSVFGPSPVGIWMMTFVVDEDTVSTCSTNIDENFDEGYVPGEGSSSGSDWTYTQSFDPSDSLGFAQVETTTQGGAVMVVGGLAYPGEKVEDGVWRFEWVDETTDTQTSAHDSGYRYSVTTHSTTSGVVRFVPTAGGLATGTLISNGTTEIAYVETDEYDQDLTFEIGPTGQIPASSYLVYEDGGDEYPQVNEYDVEDCNATTCQLTVSDQCSIEVQFDAERTDFKEEAAYAHIQDAGQGSI